MGEAGGCLSVHPAFVPTDHRWSSLCIPKPWWMLSATESFWRQFRSLFKSQVLGTLHLLWFRDARITLGFLFHPLPGM